MTTVPANCSFCHDQLQNTGKSAAEKRALVVSAITLVTMILEISFGLITGSMALLADGVHMGTHAVALLITMLAYFFTRKLSANPAFSFGTGKIGVLGGFTNALLLALTALFMIYETVERLLNPEHIDFDSAIIVAIIGLTVNLLCALILGGSHSHDTHHGHAHPHDEHEHGNRKSSNHKDTNLNAAFAHVITDAATSVLAIAALLLGKFAGFGFLDSLAGLLGALLILKWAYHLIRDSAAVLLDFGDYQTELSAIRKRLTDEGCELLDIHLWRYSENDRALMLTLHDPEKRNPDTIRSFLREIIDIDHITIEVKSL